MTIPTYREASDRRCEGRSTALDHFITEWQPMPDEIGNFRRDLQDVILEIEKKFVIPEKRSSADRACDFILWVIGVSFVLLIVFAMIMGTIGIVRHINQ